jgi:SAM-dependent methyltransferase
MASEWFAQWFDSPYYHLLYNNRDSDEAQGFIHTLLDFLQPPAGAACLDLACGSGRHAVYLAQNGLDVIGLDLSVESIQTARQYESDNLRFYSHDMRQPFHSNYFDYVFNFFTSFGYFKSQREHQLALKNISNSLRSQGVFVLDFLNPTYVKDHLVQSETVERGNIKFLINRQIFESIVKKTIQFSTPEGKHYRHQEQVYLFEKTDFEAMFAQVGLDIMHVFGDYQLLPYYAAASPRMVIVAKKRVF